MNFSFPDYPMSFEVRYAFLNDEVLGEDVRVCEAVTFFEDHIIDSVAGYELNLKEKSIKEKRLLRKRDKEYLGIIKRGLSLRANRIES